MSDQSKLGLGQIITTEQHRDAIHVAIAPVKAGMSLHPGSHVEIVDGVAMQANKGAIGVVDPFLKCRVADGETFWLFLYPGSITSLRHEWAHPAFAPGRISQVEHATKSHAWIAEHAASLGLSADVLMENAETWLRDDDHTVQHGSERWRDSFHPTEFWHHFEIVTGKVVPEEKKRSFYCCSC